MNSLTHLRQIGYRVRGATRQAAARARHAPALEAFRRFHDGLETRDDVLYMFFTSGLLHWVDRALRYVPEDVPLVLLGSALTPEEVAWLETSTTRPFHHIRRWVDDNTALSFVFDTAEANFGWLHVDCFVLDPSLFARMRDIGDDVVVNGIWSQAPDQDGGFRALHSAFVFFNHKALNRVREAGMSGSPLAAHYQGIAMGRAHKDHPNYCRVPTGPEIRALRRILPERPDGLPQYPHDGDYFQILVLYQAVAEGLGFRTHHVLDLSRDGSGAASHYSNDILHVNGVATYRLYKDSDNPLGQRLYPLLLQADYQMLSAMSGTPPAYYQDLRRELEAELAEMGLGPAEVARNLGGYLLQRGIRPERAAPIVGEETVTRLVAHMRAMAADGAQAGGAETDGA